jgi:hypothetical protein
MTLVTMAKQSWQVVFKFNKFTHSRRSLVCRNADFAFLPSIHTLTSAATFPARPVAAFVKTRIFPSSMPSALSQARLRELFQLRILTQFPDQLLDLLRLAFVRQ